MKTKAIIHPIPPVYDKNSRVLVLGSFPSVKSREYGFFYGHPQTASGALLQAFATKKRPKPLRKRRRFF